MILKNMKLAAVAAVMSIGIVSLMSISVDALESYLSTKGQLVITGLQPKQKIEVKYKTHNGRTGQRQVTANRCGEALVSKAGKYQSVVIDHHNIGTINNQEIMVGGLKIQEHPRCRVSKK
jgi:ABC-type tungstate transport system permease subunit